MQATKRFAKAAFEHGDEATKATLAAELAQALSDRLREATDFHGAVRNLVEELRALGHDLWSFDESDAFEVWCPNYHSPSGPGIVVTFTSDGVQVEWSKS